MFLENTDKADIRVQISLKFPLMTTNNRSRVAHISLKLFCTILIVALILRVV